MTIDDLAQVKQVARRLAKWTDAKAEAHLVSGQRVLPAVAGDVVEVSVRRLGHAPSIALVVVR